MHQGLRIAIVDRREFVLGIGAGTALALLLTGGAATATAQDRPATLEDLLKKITRGAKPSEGKLSIELPETAENGNIVPFTLSVDSPMTDQDYVKAIHLFATGNPQLDVATFHFTPASGRAALSSRMRLARTQDVVALAELSSGAFLLGKRAIKVVIGGCGAG
jgi:sulfur-oxidizing protein SoxY